MSRGLQRTTHPMATRKPALTLCDFILWRHIKNKDPVDLAELKQRITTTINGFDSNTLTSVWRKWIAGYMKTAAETVGIFRLAFNDDALGKSQVYEWFSSFKSGNTSTEDIPRPGRPKARRNDKKHCQN
ncbi:HTH_48 domain-containing protein [Trichonephila clavipes]|nr:HTH_48 domain-containing protein [Trichonephila clavipes]